MTHKVFVYGSLKEGYWNNTLLNTSTKIGDAVTETPAYALYDGGFPYALTNGDNRIYGELYEVDDYTLRSLDILEGVPHHYVRHETKVVTTSLDTVDCLMYVASDSAASHVRNTRKRIEPQDEYNIVEWEK